MGLSAFEEAVKNEPPSTNRQYVEMVERVGQRLAKAADKSDYKWEFKVLQSPQQNAFCLPGGKVAVYEGILAPCQNESGLAVVMSHEIAHALARHGGERMSHQYAVEGVKHVVTFASRKQTEKTQELVMQAYGAASKYGVILPYSRKHESEADHMGVMLMSRAGYDPNEAPRFWQRFAAMKTDNQPSEFLSTHPSDERRSRELTDLLPEALELYAKAESKYGLGDTIALASAPAGPAPGGPGPNGPPVNSFQPFAAPGFVPPGFAPPGFAPPNFAPNFAPAYPPFPGRA